MKITIRSKHISEGKPNSRANNPLVAAIKSACSNASAYRGARTTVILSDPRVYLSGVPYMLPPVAQFWLNEFNAGVNMEPLTFSLERL